jgi:4-hydroxybenzoate polyprenyltransferase
LKKLRGLLKASHFGPTLLVTAISWFFAAYYWWEGPAYVIAFGVFTGQLVVGWSNDLYDYQDDLMHNRQNKPLVSGVITRKYLTNWLRFMVPFSFVANLLGPLGFKGGLV